MKKALLTCMALLYLLANTFGQTFELRLNNAGNGFIAVEMRETSGKPPRGSDIFTDLVFGICWDKKYDIDLGEVSSNYTIRKAGPETVSGQIEYQQFAKDPNPVHFPADWGNGQWVTILTVPNNMASNQAVGTFSVCPTNLQELNINYNLADYSVIAAGSATNVRIGTVMPVGLRRFAAIGNPDGSVGLEWQTISDSDLVRFELEHSSDGQIFSRFASVPAKPVPPDSLYNYRHEPNAAGAHYYRIYLIAANGHHEYSPVRIVQFERTNDWTLTPNPSQGDLSVLLFAAQDEEILLSVLDASGKSVYQDVVGVQRGPNRHAIRLGDIPAGVYRVNIRWSDNSTQSKNVVVGR